MAPSKNVVPTIWRVLAAACILAIYPNPNPDFNHLYRNTKINEMLMPTTVIHDPALYASICGCALTLLQNATGGMHDIAFMKNLSFHQFGTVR